MSGTQGYYYSQDQDAYIVRELNRKLEEYEGPHRDRKYHAYRNLQDYCERRFLDQEERFTCLVITDSLDSNYTADYCQNRIFSFDNTYFEFNLVFKYSCIRDRLGDKLYIGPEISQHLKTCLDGNRPRIWQQKCLEKLEEKHMYVNPFNQTYEPHILKKYQTRANKVYDYAFEFKQKDLQTITAFDEELIEQFVCQNANASMNFNSTLKYPQHLTTIMGQQYQRVARGVGWYSLHFDPDGPFLDLTSTPEDWLFDNGTHPGKLQFANYSYDVAKRHFEGIVDLGGDYYDISYHAFNLTFTEDFAEIETGYREDWSRTGELAARYDHSGGAASRSFQYEVLHPIPPISIQQNCQVFRFRSLLGDIDYLLAYYKIAASTLAKYDQSMPMVQARDSNSTTFVYNVSDKMSFVEIHNQKLFVDSHD